MNRKLANLIVFAWSMGWVWLAIRFFEATR